MTVRHRFGSYEVRFMAPSLAFDALPRPAFVVTDSTVRRLHGRLIPADLPVLELEPGEATKSPTAYLKTVAWLAKSGAQRDANVIAFGGGVVGDLAGFAAATYMRGVACIQIPTTLLAQVDSSVGGKVGVDLPEGKNMLGAFYPPADVRIATGILETLPRRQFANGMAEVLKYGFIMAPEILALDPAAKLDELVERCVECKRDVVQDDELETTGRRAILNFGHTVGHAIERTLGYAELLHGEAISIGMAVEARLSERLSIAPAGTLAQVADRLDREGLPTYHPVLEARAPLIEAMQRDKKSTDGALAFSLLERVGVCRLVKSVGREEVEAALSDVKAFQ